MPTCAEARPGDVPLLRRRGTPGGGSAGHRRARRGRAAGSRAAGRRRAPRESLVTVRRYRCRACKAVLVVGPLGLVRGRWYGAGAIALALEAYGRGETSVSIRRRVSPSAVVGASARERWVTLVRWIEAARGGRLFAVSGLG